VYISVHILTVELIHAIIYSKYNGSTTYREEQVIALLKLYTKGYLRAVKRISPLVFADSYQAVMINFRNPEYVRNTNDGDLAFVDSARQPVLILETSSKNTELYAWRDKSTGVPCLKETRHNTRECACVLLVMNNNLEARYVDNIVRLNQYNISRSKIIRK